MSRSGYSDDCEDLELWRGAVASAIRGKRGQSFFRDLAVALDGMPEKRLIADELQSASGEFCAIGVLGAARGMDMAKLDPEDRESVAGAFNIAPALAAEIVFENDENDFHWDASISRSVRETPEQRWLRMRQWIESNLTKDPQ